MNRNHPPLDWRICKTELKKLVRDDTKILDVGCNTGEKAHYLFTEGNLVLCDLERLLEYRFDNFVQTSAVKLPFADESFDVVTALHVIEHIKEDKAVIDEAYRVLKAEGVMLLVTPNKNRPSILYTILLKLFRRTKLGYPMNADHVFEYGRKDLERLLGGSLFRDFAVSPIYARFSRLTRLDVLCDQYLVVAKKVGEKCAS